MGAFHCQKVIHFFCIYEFLGTGTISLICENVHSTKAIDGHTNLILRRSFICFILCIPISFSLSDINWTTPISWANFWVFLAAKPFDFRLLLRDDAVMANWASLSPMFTSSVSRTTLKVVRTQDMWHMTFFKRPSAVGPFPNTFFLKGTAFSKVISKAF